MWNMLGEMTCLLVCRLLDSETSHQGYMEKTGYWLGIWAFEMDAMSGWDLSTVSVREGVYPTWGRVNSQKGGLWQSLLFPTQERFSLSSLLVEPWICLEKQYARLKTTPRFSGQWDVSKILPRISGKALLSGYRYHSFSPFHFFFLPGTRWKFESSGRNEEHWKW